jgi:hypothetical protein
MTDLSNFADLAPRDHGLCVISTLRPDGSAQSSVVNAGVMKHPLGDTQVVALVATGARANCTTFGPILEPRSSPAPHGDGQPSRDTPR